MATQFIFDARGSILPAHSIADSIGWRGPSGSAIDYAVRNTGAILVAIYGRHCRIELNPKTVSHCAFAGVAQWLMDERFERVGLRQRQGNEIDEILGDSVAAVKRLSEIIRKQSDKGAAFLSKASYVSQLSAQHPFRDLIDLWRFSSSDHDLAHYDGPLHNLVNARFIIARVEENSSLVFHDVGPGVQLYSENWHRSTVGLRIQDQPNYEMGVWIAETYRDTIIANKPRLDDVDVIVKRPRQSSKHICYKRVLLPLSGSFRGVLCATLLDPSINLRFGAEHEAEDIVD